MFRQISIYPGETGAGTVAAAADDSIFFYSLTDGNASSTIPTNQGAHEGVDLIEFTHQPHMLLYTPGARSAGAQRFDFTVRLLNAETSQVVRAFPGHEQRVMSLSQNPRNDVFLTSSADRTVRLWDARKPTPIAVVKTQAPAVAQFDPTGMVFCQASDSGIRMAAQSNPDQPFATFTMPDTQVQFNTMAFSGSGFNILLGATNGDLYFFNNLKTISQLGRFSGHQIATGGAVVHQPCFSVDESTVCVGDAAGVTFYQASRPDAQSTRLNTPASTPVATCAWHPDRALFITGGHQLLFWAPV